MWNSEIFRRETKDQKGPEKKKELRNKTSGKPGKIKKNFRERKLEISESKTSGQPGNKKEEKINKESKTSGRPGILKD